MKVKLNKNIEIIIDIGIDCGRKLTPFVRHTSIRTLERIKKCLENNVKKTNRIENEINSTYSEYLVLSIRPNMNI